MDIEKLKGKSKLMVSSYQSTPLSLAANQRGSTWALVLSNFNAVAWAIFRSWAPRIYCCEAAVSHSLITTTFTHCVSSILSNLKTAASRTKIYKYYQIFDRKTAPSRSQLRMQACNNKVSDGIFNLLVICFSMTLFC